MSSVADPEGVQAVRSNPLPAPVFKYPMKMKTFGLSETKLFHFHGIFKQNEIKSANPRRSMSMHSFYPEFISKSSHLIYLAET